MKLLLVNTPIDLHDTLGRFSSLSADLKMVPSGLAYLAAVVREAGVEVKILDQYAEGLSLDQISELIKDFSPDLIGYGATTPNYFAAINMVHEVRKRHPQIRTVLGGHHPSIFSEETLRNEAVDFVIRDEGEYPLVALCKAIERGDGNFAGIAGLSYKTDAGQIHHNEKSPPVDVNMLPLPAYDLLPVSLYGSPAYTHFASPVIQMVASRGCPFSCSYCINAEMNIAAKYRRRNIDSVVSEMEMLIHKYGARQIQFWDPIFPQGAKHAVAFCEEVIRRGLHKKIVWNSTTRAEMLTEESIRLMARAGCRGLGFGIESGVQELLQRVGKKQGLDNIRRACTLCKKNGIVLAGAFIIGFPGETREMTRMTIEYAKSLDIHYAQFSIMVPYPGTPLYRELKDGGELLGEGEQDFARYNQSVGLTDLEPVYVPKGREAVELKRMQRQAYIEFYLRPRQVLMLLTTLTIPKIISRIPSLLAILGLAMRDIISRMKNRVNTGPKGGKPHHPNL
jgi:anaerobic magnesium-protoporphyrin IX monomethyl ester cyclase